MARRAQAIAVLASRLTALLGVGGMRIAVLILLATLAITSAVASELSGLEQRAAYCIGVLRYHVEHNPIGAGRDVWCEENWRGRYPTREACNKELSDVEQAMDNALREKLARYRSYLKTQLAQRATLDRPYNDNARGAAFVGITHIEKKGRDDAGAIEAEPVQSHWRRCIERCVTSAEP